MRFRKGFLAIGLFLGILVSNSFSLEPRLLWKMEIKDKLWNVSFAKVSADVLFTSGENKNKITLISKEGNILWQWGPDLERTILSISISDDGRYFVFYSEYQMDVELKKGWAPKIHFFEKGRGELWNRPTCGDVVVSSDGKYVFVSSPCGNMFEGESELWTNEGKLLWHKDLGIRGVKPIFVPGDKFIWTSRYIIDLKGNILMDFPGQVSSISEDFNYIATEMSGTGVEVRVGGKLIRGTPTHYGAIRDKNNNVILSGRARVSGNGKIGVIYEENKVKIYKLPERVLQNEYPIQKKGYDYYYSDISYDGTILVILGKRTDGTSDNNLFLIDLRDRALKEYKIKEEGSLTLTKDGRFLLINYRKGLCLYEIL